MHDQNRHRLKAITSRHARRSGSDDEPASEIAFPAAFALARETTLRPVMEAIGAELEAAGYRFEVTPHEIEGSPAVDFHIVIPDHHNSKDVIRWFAKKDPRRGWQVIAELELKGSPVELTRFATVEEVTCDVTEQLLVDAVEQMFASSGAH